MHGLHFKPNVDLRTGFLSSVSSFGVDEGTSHAAYHTLVRRMITGVWYCCRGDLELDGKILCQTVYEGMRMQFPGAFGAHSKSNSRGAPQYVLHASFA